VAVSNAPLTPAASTGRVLLGKRASPPSAVEGNESDRWIVDDVFEHDARRQRHFDAAARFERPASLHQLLDVLPPSVAQRTVERSPVPAQRKVSACVRARACVCDDVHHRVYRSLRHPLLMRVRRVTAVP
jgi:hypothetical protein